MYFFSLLSVNLFTFHFVLCKSLPGQILVSFIYKIKEENVLDLACWVFLQHVRW